MSQIHAKTYKLALVAVPLPDGKMRAVASHHSSVQFCWKGVTGMITALALVMAGT